MNRLTKLVSIVFLMMELFVLGSRKVQAQVQCANWTCSPPQTCKAGAAGCPYGGWISTCHCGDVDCLLNPELCPSCGPGSYVCNRPGNCCPYDVCGNTSCDAGEDCSNCPGDCGACNGGGGGGGGGGSYCGDGTCDLDENCTTCPSDCPCPVVSADVKADGSDANITVAAPYNVSWSSVDAVGCFLNSSNVDRSGSNPYSNPPGTYPYNLLCNGVDTQATDAVSVTVDCNALAADVKVNGADTDITTYNDYTVSWSSAGVGSCTLNGSSVAASGSQSEVAAVNGTYPYTLECSTSVCTDSDTVNVTVDLCGNGTCNAFENCALCAADCGACPTAWWQVRGGNLYSAATSGEAIVSDVADPASCVEPSCVPGLSILDRADTANSDGFPVTAGGGVDANGQMITYRDPDVAAIGAKTTRLYENYTYFYSLYSLGVAPVDDFVGGADDALKPTYLGKEAYFHSGDLTIQSPWHVAAGESYVIFVDGNLNIQDPLDEGELIKVDEGGFLAFIVSGDITIEDTVGHSVLTNTAGNVEGVYVADGTLTVASNGTDDKKFVGEGSFVGWTGVVINRTYDEVGPNNDYYPAETFVYRPDFVKNVPEKMQRAQMIWQETN